MHFCKAISVESSMIYILAFEVGLAMFIEDVMYGRNARRIMIRRLQGYSLWSSGRSRDGGESRDELDEDGHRILLGTLKKVEQKNSVLVTILVFLESAFLASLFVDVDDHECAATLLKYCAIGAFPALLASLVGIRHLDVSHIRDRMDLPLGAISHALQQDLITDLLRKEFVFKLAWYIVFIDLAALFLGLIWIDFIAR